MDPSFGLLATLTTGPTTRRVLSDDVKLFLRAIALLGPDTEFVCRVLFQAEGFQNAELLARKLVACFTLSAQVLSKSDHYCFGLQTMKLCVRLMGQRVFPPDHATADTQTGDKVRQLASSQGASHGKWLFVSFSVRRLGSSCQVLYLGVCTVCALPFSGAGRMLVEQV